MTIETSRKDRGVGHAVGGAVISDLCERADVLGYRRRRKTS